MKVVEFDHFRIQAGLPNWLELLAETDYLPTCDQTASVLDECKSLIAILAASVKTAKGEK